MAKLDELNNKVERLKKQLEDAKKEARKQARIEAQKAKREAYQRQVEEALELIEIAKNTSLDVNHQTISVYEHLKRLQQGGVQRG